MKDSNNYKINVKSFLFTDKLEEEFSLIDEPGLDEAVLLINNACSKQVQLIEKRKRENFCFIAYKKIKAAQSQGDDQKIMDILKEISMYNENKD